MVVLKEEMIQAIVSEKNFQTQTHNLLHALNYETNAKAGHDLLYHFLNIRCRDMTADEFEKSWNDHSNYKKGVVNRKYLNWLITFSVRDIVKQHADRTNSETEMKAYLQEHLPTSSNNVDDDTDKMHRGERERLRLLCLYHLPHIFPRSPQKRKIAEIILTQGQKEAERYIQSKSKTRLNRWLQIIGEYCDKRRPMINKILGRELSNSERKRLTFINTFITIEDAENLTLFAKQGKQAELIDQHRDVFDEIVGRCGEGSNQYITHQKALIYHWERIEFQDEKCDLVEYMRMQQSELENKLKNGD